MAMDSDEELDFSLSESDEPEDNETLSVLGTKQIVSNLFWKKCSKPKDTILRGPAKKKL